MQACDVTNTKISWHIDASRFACCESFFHFPFGYFSPKMDKWTKSIKFDWPLPALGEVDCKQPQITEQHRDLYHGGFVALDKPSPNINLLASKQNLSKFDLELTDKLMLKCDPRVEIQGRKSTGDDGRTERPFQIYYFPASQPIKKHHLTVRWCFFISCIAGK